MASMINLKLSRNELLKLVSSYLILGEFLEDVVGSKQIYKSTFMKGLRTAVGEYKKRLVKEVKSIHDLAA